MKNALLFITILWSMTATAQWQTIPTGLNQQTLHDISFFGTQHILVGAGQNVIYSHDNGQTWGDVSLAGPLGFIGIAGVYGVHLSDAETAVASGLINLGNTQMILRSNDGFQTWSTVHNQPSGEWPRLVNQFSFPSNQIGFAVGHSDRIIKTNNGGASWTVSQSAGAEINNISMYSSNRGIATGNHFVLNTTDGGISWALTPNQYDLYTVTMASSTVVYASDDNYFVKSIDGGQTWQEMNVAFSRANSLIAFGVDTLFAGTEGGLFFSANGGLAWEIFPETKGKNITRVERHGNDYWALGTNGLLMRANGVPQTAPIGGFSGGGGCPKTPYLLSNTSVFSPNYSYQWWLNDSLISSDYNTTIIFPDFTTFYQVKMVVNNGFFADTAIWSITTPVAFHFPTGNLTIQPARPCEGGTGVLHYDSAWVWAVYDLLKNGTLVHQWSGASNNLSKVEGFSKDSVQYVIRSAFFDGCFTTNFVDTLNVIPVQSAANLQITLDKNILCLGDTIQIHVDNTQLNNSYSVSNSSPSLSQYGNGGELIFNSVSATYNLTGFQVLCTSGGCQTYKFAPVSVEEPVAVTDIQNQALTGQPFQFMGQSYLAVAWEWEFGATATPSVSNQPNPLVTYSQEGASPFQLVVTGGGGCQDTLHGFTDVFIPSAWSEEGEICTQKEPAAPLFHSFYERIRDAAVDAQGNFFVVGSLDTLASNVSEVGFVWKLDANGQIIWKRRIIPNYWDEYEAGGNASCRSIAVDASTGDIYVNGEFKSLYLKIGDFTFDFTEKRLRFFIVKIKSDGQILWANVLDNRLNGGAPNNIVYAGHDHLYVSVYSRGGSITRSGGLPAQLWGPEFWSTSDSESHFLRFDESGKMVDDQPFTLPSSSDLGLWGFGAPRMRLTPQGHIMFYGVAYTTLYLDNFTITPPPNTAENLSGFFAVWDTTQREWLSAFPAFGVRKSSYQLDYWDNSMLSPAFDADSAGNIYLAFAQTALYLIGEDLIPSVILPDSSALYGQEHGVLMKFSPSGERLWTKMNGPQQAVGLETLPNGRFALISNFGGFAGFDGQNGLNLAFPAIASSDWMVSVWDDDGNFQYARNMGTTAHDKAYVHRERHCGRFLVIHTSSTSDQSGTVFIPTLNIFSPDGECMGTPLGCEVIVPVKDISTTLSTGLFPNPTSGLFTLEWAGNSISSFNQSTEIATNLRIYDTLGRLMREEKISATGRKFQISIETLPDGMYCVVIIDNNSKVSFNTWIMKE